MTSCFGFRAPNSQKASYDKSHASFVVKVVAITRGWDRAEQARRNGGGPCSRYTGLAVLKKNWERYCSGMSPKQCVITNFCIAQNVDHNSQARLQENKVVCQPLQRNVVALSPVLRGIGVSTLELTVSSRFFVQLLAVASQTHCTSQINSDCRRLFEASRHEPIARHMAVTVPAFLPKTSCSDLL